MSNKIDTAMDNLETALKTLATSGVLKAVKRGIINPLTEPTGPVAALAVSRARRESGRIWLVDVLVQVAAKAVGKSADETTTGLLASCDGAIEALEAAGTAGCVWDTPLWDFWYVRDQGGLTCVGLIGGLQMRIEAPLKT